MSNEPTRLSLQEFVILLAMGQFIGAFETREETIEFLTSRCHEFDEGKLDANVTRVLAMMVEDGYELEGLPDWMRERILQ